MSDSDEVKSKSQHKRERLALRKFAEQLVSENVVDLHDLSLPAEVHHAVLEARRIKKGARKRQIKHLTGLLSRVDHDAIADALQTLRQPHLRQVEREKQINSLRERLLSDDDGCYDQLRAVDADFDPQPLRQLVRKAKKELERGEAGREFRRLYQYLAKLPLP